MVQVASLFNQLLHHFPRLEFAGLAKKHQAERAAKGFDCWTQFVAMLFCQFGHADSLREICNGLACCLGKLVHLGIVRAPNKSTLSYANQHRPAALYQDLFYAALARFRQQQGLGVRKRKFRFRNKLLSLDSTTISLCLSIFPWARCRHHKGGVKAHVLLDHDDYLPRYVLITEARAADVRMAHALALPTGSIVAMDRGYVDFRLFARWTEDGIFFVTRPLQHMVFEVIASRPTPKNSTIRSDQTIRFNSEWAQRHGFKIPLRRIVVWNEEHQQEIVLLSNHFGFAASTLAAIYKERWEIELFFKALKQNLKIKTSSVQPRTHCTSRFGQP
ncbi:MAG: IS4 family transposase [Terracidiphilus sp.]